MSLWLKESCPSWRHLSQLKAAPDVRVLQEIRDGQFTGVTGPRIAGIGPQGAHISCGEGPEERRPLRHLLAANSIRWIAMDLAAMAEGLIVVPLYFRQAPAELIAMMKDSTPALVCCGDATLRDGIQQAWPAGLRRFRSSMKSSREWKRMFAGSPSGYATKIRSRSSTRQEHRAKPRVSC